MKCTYEYDLDPRYGWARVDVEGFSEPLIIIQDEEGSHGFIYKDGEMKPTCLCNAWNEGECACGLYGVS